MLIFLNAVYFLDVCYLHNSFIMCFFFRTVIMPCYFCGKSCVLGKCEMLLHEISPDVQRQEAEVCSSFLIFHFFFENVFVYYLLYHIS